MPVKTQVRFKISNPTQFLSEEDYPSLGIKALVEGGKLVAVETVVEHKEGAGHEEILAEARATILPLLKLLEFGYGGSLVVTEVQTHAVEPESPIAIGLGYVRADAVTIRLIPMPPEGIVANLSGGVLRQVGWYLTARNSTSVIDRVRSYYEVLELEKSLSAGSASPYTPPQPR